MILTAAAAAAAAAAGAYVCGQQQVSLTQV